MSRDGAGIAPAGAAAAGHAASAIRRPRKGDGPRLAVTGPCAPLAWSPGACSRPRRLEPEAQAGRRPCSPRAVKRASMASQIFASSETSSKRSIS